jgi:hypothetical protein
MVLTGRGGFGNHRQGSQDYVPSSPAPIQHFSSPTQKVRAGRGGYGNYVDVKNMPTLTPQEYLQEVHEALDVEPERYFTGRGGRGNLVRKDKRKDSASSTSGDNTSTRSLKPSTTSGSSNQNKLWSRLKTTLTH